MFTASTSGAQTNEYEIMVWLAALGGAVPISSTGSSVATPSIGGVQWTLFSGSNGVNNVFSFVTATEQTSFNGDLNQFLDYLVANEGLSSSQYLNVVEAGTEPFNGNEAQLTTTAYSITVA
jgi:xyloglucan-specific endo-beta-1,4-glucanase